MIVAPPQIIACPLCGAPTQLSGFRSDHTMSGDWTDYAFLGRNARDFSNVIACGTCDECYFEDDAIRPGAPENAAFPNGRPEVPYAREPTEAQYSMTIQNLFGPRGRWPDDRPRPPQGRAREIRVRLLALQKHNDPVRHGNPGAVTADTADDRENLQALAALLDETDPAARLLKAEVYRELGAFDWALVLLDYPFDSYLRHTAIVIRRCAAAGDRAVAPVFGTEGYTAEDYDRMARERAAWEAERAAAREADDRLHRRGRFAVPAWQPGTPRFQQFFTFVCPFCEHAEEVGLWFPSKTCSKCSGVCTMVRPNG